MCFVHKLQSRWLARPSRFCLYTAPVGMPAVHDAETCASTLPCHCVLLFGHLSNLRMSTLLNAMKLYSASYADRRRLNAFCSELARQREAIEMHLKAEITFRASGLARGSSNRCCCCYTGHKLKEGEAADHLAKQCTGNS